ncbi:Apoptotic chromatin condensation inducer in the nucleus [Sarcoptes scabiei]|nr:Apoptotic chromatin condensation inducer in the nucleus [Sarcoptes scabiei]
MSEFSVDGKPLSSLRVVDLREELKKRGIRSSGTKSQLQQLLLQALATSSTSQEPTEEHQEEQISEVPQPVISQQTNTPIESPKPLQVIAVREVIESQNSTLPIEDSNLKEEKIASLSINEEKETIKLTIRSSPRKSEPIPQHESETEESDESDSKDSKPQKIEISRGPMIQDSVPDSSSPLEKDVAETFALSDPSIKPTDSESIEKKEEADVDEAKESAQMSSLVEQGDKLDTSNVNLAEQSSKSSNDSKKSLLKNRFRNHRVVDTKGAEDKQAQPRKRAWGASSTPNFETNNQASSLLQQGISSDKLKELITPALSNIGKELSSVAPPKSTLKVSKTFAENKSVEKINNKSNNELKKSDVSSIKTIDLNANNIDPPNHLKSKDSEIVEESDLYKTRALSPAKNPESTVLFITGLVRPYTLQQLKKLLNDHGKIDEEKFWIDPIKSKCYVVYSTIDEAIETRKALHNLKWPQSSPKNLHVEFATLEDIDRCINPDNYEGLPHNQYTRTTIDTSRNIAQSIDKKHDFDPKESTKIDLKQTQQSSQPQRPIRDWDREKFLHNRHDFDRKDDPRIPTKRSRHSSPQLKSSPAKTSSVQAEAAPLTPSNIEKDQTIDQHHLKQESKADKIFKDSRDTHGTQAEYSKRERTKSPSPVNLLESLFRKTKTQPYIYWLPLTEEQSIEREQTKALQEKDRQMRLAMRKSSQSPAQSRSPFNRRRSPPMAPYRRKPIYSPRRRPNYSRSPIDRHRRLSSPRNRSPDRRRSPRRQRSPARRRVPSPRLRSPDRRRMSPPKYRR